MGEHGEFAIGMRVGWTLKDGTMGTGTVVGGDDVHTFVAVDPLPATAPVGQAAKEFHPVIYCSNTWLHVVG